MLEVPELFLGEGKWSAETLTKYREAQEDLNKEKRTATIARLNRIEDTVKNLEYGEGSLDKKGRLIEGEDPTKPSAKAVRQIKDAASKLGLDKGEGKIDLGKIDSLELLDLVQRSLIEQREKFSVRQDASGRFVLPTFHKPLAENERKFLE